MIFLAKNTQGWAFILVMFDPIQEIQRLGMGTLCEWVLWYLKTWELKRRRGLIVKESALVSVYVQQQADAMCTTQCTHVVITTRLKYLCSLP